MGVFAAVDWSVAGPLLGVTIPGLIGLIAYALASRERRARLDLDHLAMDNATVEVRNRSANDSAERINALLEAQAAELERERRHRREDEERFAAQLADALEVSARERAWKHEARNNAMLADAARHGAELDRENARRERDHYLARLIEAGLVDRPADGEATDGG